jgi:hypothetical protein
MTSEQCAELVHGHADNGQNVAQGALGYVTSRVDRYGDCTSIRVPHHVMASSYPHHCESGALKRLYYLRSRYDRDAARHKPGSYQKSGNVECQSQLVWWSDYVEQSFKRGAQIFNRLFLRRTIADGTNARAKLG